MATHFQLFGILCFLSFLAAPMICSGCFLHSSVWIAQKQVKVLPTLLQKCSSLIGGEEHLVTFRMLDMVKTHEAGTSYPKHIHVVARGWGVRSTEEDRLYGTMAPGPQGSSLCTRGQGHRRTSMDALV